MEPRYHWCLYRWNRCQFLWASLASEMALSGSKPTFTTGSCTNTNCDTDGDGFRIYRRHQFRRILHPVQIPSTDLADLRACTDLVSTFMSMSGTCINLSPVRQQNAYQPGHRPEYFDIGVNAMHPAPKTSWQILQDNRCQKSGDVSILQQFHRRANHKWL